MALYRIEKLYDDRRDAGLNLAEAVYDRSESKRRSTDANEFFHEAVSGYRAFEDFSVFGAYKDESLMGVLVADPQMATVCLLIVSESARNCGVGSALVKYFMTMRNPGGATVNADISAVEFYRSLGFRCIGEPKEENGFTTVKMFGC